MNNQYCRYCGLDDHFETECGPQEETTDHAADIDRHHRAMQGEEPCPICAVTVHPQLKCGDGRVVSYCSPNNTRKE